MESKRLFVVKASGIKAPYSESKLRHSLRRAGADAATVADVLTKIQAQVTPGMHTRHIRRMALSLLKRKSRSFAGRYNLKQAIMELGPSGFPFEKYVAEIFRFRGYSVSVDQFIRGICVTHEVDVVAEKDGRRLMIECKYHNNSGLSCDVKIPLYIHSRFLDLDFDEGWVATNTRFTSDAVKYGMCVGLKMLAWDFPAGHGLKDWIDQGGLYPITALSRLSRNEKHRVLAQGFVLCKDLMIHPEALNRARIPREQHSLILNECEQTCRL